MDVRVANLRRGPWGAALAFFDVVLEESLMAKGFVLRKSKKNEFYWQAPSKLRTEKATGKPVKDDNGYDVYDPIVDLWGEKKEGKFTPTESAWELKAEITRQAVEAYEAASDDPQAAAGRGGSKTSKPASKPAPVKAAAKEGTTAAIVGDGEFADDNSDDDDLPF